MVSFETIAAVEELQRLGREHRIRGAVMHADFESMIQLNKELLVNGKVAYTEPDAAGYCKAYHAHADDGPASEGVCKADERKAERAPDELAARLDVASKFHAAAYVAWYETRKALGVALNAFELRMREWDDE